MHIVGQKTVQNNFSEADELLLTGVKNGKNNTIPWTLLAPAWYCLQCNLLKSVSAHLGRRLTYINTCSSAVTVLVALGSGTGLMVLATYSYRHKT